MTIESDEAAVRAYLRVVIGAPERATATIASTEAGFISCAARWARRHGVDRATLRALGVRQPVLELAAVTQLTAGDMVRRHYSRKPFDVASLARRSVVTVTTVRRTVTQDAQAGIIELVPHQGRGSRWRLVKS